MKEVIWITNGTTRRFNFIDDVENASYIKFARRESPIITLKENQIGIYYPTTGGFPKIHGEKVINTNQKAIETARNKREFRIFCIENDIPIPKTWFRIKDAEIPYIIRREYHSLNLNMIVVDKGRRHRENEKWIKNKHKLYFSKVLDIENEYRMFVLDNKIVLIFDRDWRGNLEDTINHRDGVRRNPELTFTRRECYDEISEEHKQICLDAVKKLGIGFTAVDFAIDKEGKLYILEMNTHPTISGEIVQEALAHATRQLINEEEITPYQPTKITNTP